MVGVAVGPPADAVPLVVRIGNAAATQPTTASHLLRRNLRCGFILMRPPSNATSLRSWRGPPDRVPLTYWPATCALINALKSARSIAYSSASRQPAPAAETARRGQYVPSRGVA